MPDIELPPKDCLYGYPDSQVTEILGDREEAFNHWMRGQTMSVCDGWKWNQEQGSHEPTGCGPHGAVVYGHDLKRFLAGGPILD